MDLVSTDNVVPVT